MTAKESSKSLGINQEVGTPASLINSKNHGREVKVLSADIHDALEFSVLVNKGIGAPNVYNEFGDEDSGPCCLYGHAEYIQRASECRGLLSNSIARALAIAGVDPETSDRAVYAIRLRKNKGPDYRATWREYTRELNIVRGD